MNREAGYDRKSAALNDRAVLLRYLDEVGSQIGEIRDLMQEAMRESIQPEDYSHGAPGQPGGVRIGELQDSHAQLVSTVRVMTEVAPDECRQVAMSAMAQMQALESDVDALESDLADPGSQVFLPAAAQANTMPRVFKTIKKALSGAWKRLWSLISHLLTIKEWSVSGQAGTGLLGFASATITVTFG
jgi:hypothetical protein